jgi:hypothetical protein
MLFSTLIYFCPVINIFATESFRCPLSDICLRDIVVYKVILLHTTWHCCKVSHVVGILGILFILNNNEVLE